MREGPKRWLVTLGTYSFAATITLGALATVAALVTVRKERLCINLSFGLSALASLMGLLTSISVFLEGSMSFEFTAIPFLGPFAVVIDPLAALFLAAISIVALAASIYSLGYVQQFIGRYSIAKFCALFPLFLVSMVMVVASSNVFLFLVFWELMSLSSYLLVAYEHEEEGAASAAWLYLVMAHLGTACIASCLLYLSLMAGSLDFHQISLYAGQGMTELARSGAFLLALIGFGAKAGIVPLHVWLPQAHPSAPSNVSALMSGVMVKLAVYMLIRTAFQFLHVDLMWWGLLTLFVGSLTALLGVLYAIAEKDIKRALAFSTVENVGIIFIALGAAMVFYAQGMMQIAALALVACLLHVLFHSLFKSLLFLGAGAVVHATGTKDMERMGGLGKGMRYTSILFFIGVLSISAIPPFNGFISEWLIFQSLLLSYSIHDVTVNLLMAIALGMLALTGALAAACFVRIFGSVFLARPRSEAAKHPRESHRSLLLAMSILAGLCLATGVLAAQIIPMVDQASTDVIGVSIAGQLTDGWVLEVDGGEVSSVSPILLAGLLGLMIPFAFILVRSWGGRTPRVKGKTWDCGTPLGPRNEYTPTGHSQPILRVFNPFLRGESSLSSDPTSSPYSRRGMTYSSSIPRLFETYLYEPVARTILGVARRASIIQTGSVQRYLAYIFAALILLLLVFR
ncbi:MAG: hydrogenase 4 subunit B [Methanomassiliicoccales archaeon]|nr:hydrogenase 4 subunit B [Methanomassiliicoccales archaeon]MDD1755899.1 hydrogenase 4 subunit B [Methanomassiliicoccales archaeon]